MPPTGNNQDIVQSIDALTRAMRVPYTNPDWIAPTLLGAWLYFGSPWAVPGYYKDALGHVHVRGLVKSGASASTIFVLPVGYRPAYNLRFVIDVSGTFGEITVYPNGNVNYDVGAGAPGFVSMDAVYFRAEA